MLDVYLFPLENKLESNDVVSFLLVSVLAVIFTLNYCTFEENSVLRLTLGIGVADEK